VTYLAGDVAVLAWSYEDTAFNAQSGAVRWQNASVAELESWWVDNYLTVAEHAVRQPVQPGETYLASVFSNVVREDCVALRASRRTGARAEFQCSYSDGELDLRYWVIQWDGRTSFDEAVQADSGRPGAVTAQWAEGLVVTHERNGRPALHWTYANPQVSVVVRAASGTAEALEAWFTTNR
jgi:hypothetical protein